MRCKPVVQTVILFTVALCFFCPECAKSKNVFEAALYKRIDSVINAETVTPQKELYPNDAVRSVMTPAGWGGNGTYLFGGIEGTYPEVYRSNKAGLVTFVGACTGNAEKQ